MSGDAGLWWAVVAVGVYHGLNPGMGWPLAVSSALMERRATALPQALAALATGHFLSMTAILLPFSLMVALVDWQREIRILAALIVIAMGAYLLVNRRHPRILSRVPPSKLALWSFLAALAHGAGLMLVPMYLGLCAADGLDAGHAAATALMAANLGTALAVAAVHTLAMVLAGGALALLVYLWLGVRVVSKTWFNLDLVWAVSLVAVGGIGLAGAWRS
ncbi:MAG: hypothetical protein RID15_08860 [Marinovum algicola]|uniref:Arginine/ornithine antiporter ArcD n=2 Tax=Roseobacteraceae TaxID=2854170 RepID=A0A975WDK2_9RHOB|nr:hypothetical protein [Marinovum algicola]SEK01727.1 hypothetical protein SAMN04487940_11893 [Marinovum algicola]SLN43884.1 hypothetical protein MAA5396_02140 [Marinovum algicola]